MFPMFSGWFWLRVGYGFATKMVERFSRAFLLGSSIESFLSVLASSVKKSTVVIEINELLLVVWWLIAISWWAVTVECLEAEPFVIDVRALRQQEPWLMHLFPVVSVHVYMAAFYVKLTHYWVLSAAKCTPKGQLLWMKGGALLPSFNATWYWAIHL